MYIKILLPLMSVREKFIIREISLEKGYEIHCTKVLVPSSYGLLSCMSVIFSAKINLQFDPLP